MTSEKNKNLAKLTREIQNTNRKAWEQTFDAIHDWICIIDLDSQIIRSNRIVETLFPITVQESIGKKCCQLAHGAESPVLKCPLPKMLKTKKRESAELKIKDGLWMLVTVDPIFDENNNLTSAVHIARDITKRVEAQKEKERLYKDLKKALSKVKTLKGLIPICSKCKKIRDDKGYWSLLESYIESHSDASFSHGVCPSCMDDLYGDKQWYLDMKKNKKKKL